MAKRASIKSTNKQDDTDLNDDSNEDDENGETTAAPKLTKNEASALIVAYVQADNKVTQAQEAVDAAKEDRSNCVKAIFAALGNGPFKYKDTYLGKIVQRDGNYFFRGKMDQKVQSFD